MIDKDAKYKYKTFTLRVQEDLLAAFAAVCAERGLSQSAVIRGLMSEYIRCGGNLKS